MSDTSSKATSSSSPSRIWQLYRRIRKPLMGLLLGIAIIGKIIPSPGLQYASLSLLAGFLLQLLFEIHAKLDIVLTQPRRFENVAEATAEMKKCLQWCIKRREGVHIQWIGMSMFNAWSALRLVLNWLDRELHVENVTVEIAMLDNNWLDQNKINPAWTGAQAKVVASQISTYAAPAGWRITVERYAHMPALHGGLINGKFLFVGLCRWEEEKILMAGERPLEEEKIEKILMAGERPYEFHTFRDGEVAEDKIEVFANWFRFCFDPKPDWYKFPSP